MSVVTELKVRMLSDCGSDNIVYLVSQIEAAIRHWNKENGVSHEDDRFVLDGLEVSFVSDGPLFPVAYPFEITEEQKKSLWKKWRQESNDLTFQEFVDTISGPHFGTGTILVEWSGLTIGIERNGYVGS